MPLAYAAALPRMRGRRNRAGCDDIGGRAAGRGGGGGGTNDGRRRSGHRGVETSPCRLYPLYAASARIYRGCNAGRSLVAFFTDSGTSCTGSSSMPVSDSYHSAATSLSSSYSDAACSMTLYHLLSSHCLLCFAIPRLCLCAVLY